MIHIYQTKKYSWFTFIKQKNIHDSYYQTKKNCKYIVKFKLSIHINLLYHESSHVLWQLSILSESVKDLLHCSLLYWVTVDLKLSLLVLQYLKHLSHTHCCLHLESYECLETLNHFASSKSTLHKLLYQSYLVHQQNVLDYLECLNLLFWCQLIVNVTSTSFWWNLSLNCLFDFQVS